MQFFLGQIQTFGFNYAPLHFAFCNGQLLPISSNPALFSLLGTYYGGNGTSTFGLPDLRGRSMIHYGTGTGLPPIQIGQMGGDTEFTILPINMPAHTHSIQGNYPVSLGGEIVPGSTARTSNTTNVANGNYLGNLTDMYRTEAGTGSLNGFSASGVVSLTGNTGSEGSTVPVEFRSPFQAVNICIATQGLWPSRN